MPTVTLTGGPTSSVQDPMSGVTLFHGIPGDVPVAVLKRLQDGLPDHQFDVQSATKSAEGGEK